jgi:nucleoside-diphosphate-sugar epimerase
MTTVCITGGAGFLGRAILRELDRHAGALGLGPRSVRVFDTRALEPPSSDVVDAVVGDIRDYDEVRRAFEGADVVLHCASIVDWGRLPDRVLEQVNVGGTENVIRACREAGVRALVYTSTMDVVYEGRPIRDGDETLPYPADPHEAYPRTKALAERAVVGANGAHARGTLRTCVLRPCGMYGEGDPYHVGSVLEMARRGLLRFRMGDGRARFQAVYVGNVAHAHLLAAKRLLAGDDAVSGQVYLVTDHPAENFFDAMEPIVRGVGLPFPPRTRSLPYAPLYALAAVVEGGARALRPIVRLSPILTRTSLTIVCHDFSFRGDKAARDLGYAPVYGRDEAIERTVAYFRDQSGASS